MGRSRPKNGDHCGNRLPTQPRLDPKPSAGHKGAQHCWKIRATRAETCADKYRERNTVLRPSVSIEKHRNKHDQIPQENREDSLLPVHTARNQRRGEHVRGHFHRHREPKRNVVIGAPGALRDRCWRKVLVVKPRVMLNCEATGRVENTMKGWAHCQAPPRASRRRYWPRPVAAT